ncbi:hypothetical protein CHLRE_04g216902v5 [Chlamydomonas reinhardtii]|uniref:Dynein assembly factor with WD repeat domains 1 n=1 Tax=Chlamydomonas reinhardtii TaxID=3055 RepID=A0A2K3DTB5_CHLRE|nr:uncharacterized protein CHLRE_04g216902v5 [Chlamydomonas reinhardtii]PNW83772.1 hypothetical protein CHLRE_04g216902v5 [Chlamydomonas reinhardtii]
MAAKLRKFLLRYYPPGIILQYERDGVMKQKPIDLLDLTPDVDVEVLLSQIIRQEPLISENRRPALRQLIHRLIDKMLEQQHHSFTLFKVLRAHILPLTNCAFNKSGDRFITGSYDRTCKVWNTFTGEEVFTLEGHKNVVRVVPPSSPPAPWTTPPSCGTWRRGRSGATLAGHRAEIVSLGFNTGGDLIVTGSFDHDSRLWDVRTGQCVHVLSGHRGEVSSTQFNYAGTLVVSGSIDCTSRLWDVRSGRCLSVKQGHTDEVLDVAFDAAGTKMVSASADGSARLYHTLTGVCQHTLVGHEGEISKVAFNPQGTRLITASSDKTCRLWDCDTGECLQVLEGHTDEIFSCAFNYEGDFIITGSKDNTCRIWKALTASSQPAGPGGAGGGLARPTTAFSYND